MSPVVNVERCSAKLLNNNVKGLNVVQHNESPVDNGSEKVDNWKKLRMSPVVRIKRISDKLLNNNKSHEDRSGNSFELGDSFPKNNNISFHSSPKVKLKQIQKEKIINTVQENFIGKKKADILKKDHSSTKRPNSVKMLLKKNDFGQYFVKGISGLSKYNKNDQIECREKLRNAQKRKVEDNYTVAENSLTFDCDQCSITFSNSKSLDAHKRNSTSELCNKSYQSENMNAQKPIHTELKLFSCDICKKSFQLLSALKKHKECHQYGESLNNSNFETNSNNSPPVQEEATPFPNKDYPNMRGRPPMRVLGGMRMRGAPGGPLVRGMKPIVCGAPDVRGPSVGHGAPDMQGTPMGRGAPVKRGPPIGHGASVMRGTPMRRGVLDMRGPPMRQSAPDMRGLPMGRGGPVMRGLPIRRGGPVMRGTPGGPLVRGMRPMGRGAPDMGGLPMGRGVPVMRGTPGGTLLRGMRPMERGAPDMQGVRPPSVQGAQKGPRPESTMQPPLSINYVRADPANLPPAPKPKKIKLEVVDLSTAESPPPILAKPALDRLQHCGISVTRQKAPNTPNGLKLPSGITLSRGYSTAQRNSDVHKQNGSGYSSIQSTSEESAKEPTLQDPSRSERTINLDNFTPEQRQQLRLMGII